jgi:hypothetical protein
VPRCVSALAIASPSTGSGVGKRGAWPSLPKLKYVARLPRPAGDFCPRPFRCAGPAVTALRLSTLRRLGDGSSHRLAGPACVLLQHAGTVVSRGEPLDGASPAPWLRRPWNGSADPSPLSNDSGAFPAGRTPRIMREVKRVWIEKCVAVSFYRVTVSTVRFERAGKSRAITLAVTATPPCVGVNPGLARWKKMALPRPRRRGAMFQSSTMQTS